MEIRSTCSSYNQNFSISKPLDSHTPYAVPYNIKNYIINHLRTWCCLITYLNHLHANNKGKFEPKSEPAIFLGYGQITKNYIIFDPHRKREASATNITFYEKILAGKYFQQILALSSHLLQFPVLALSLLARQIPTQQHTQEQPLTIAPIIEAFPNQENKNFYIILA